MRNFILAGSGLLMASGSALAQSSVQLSGLVDLGIGKAFGNAPWAVQESTAGNSRFTISGSEDLGGGYAAIFGLENRFRPDTGTLAVADRFWHGFSTVGMRTPHGTVNLGRQYTPSFDMVQSQIDPFGNTTVANLRDVGMRPGASVQGVNGTPNGVGTVSKARVSGSIRYDWSATAFRFAALVGEKNQEAGKTAGPNRPWSMAASYADKRYYVGVSYENPQYDNDRQWNLGVRYTVDALTVSGGWSTGRTAESQPIKGGLLGANYDIGQGSAKLGYAFSRVGSQGNQVRLDRWAAGYHYKLSKRTTLYSDLAYEKNITSGKTALDFGIFHRF